MKFFSKIGFLAAVVAIFMVATQFQPVKDLENVIAQRPDVDHPSLISTSSFNNAKTLLKKMYADNRVTFYCGCTYNEHHQVDLNSCGYKIRKNANRAHRIEWEHVVPASYFGQRLPCWGDGGRKNCQRKSTLFNKFEGDLHNLVPEVGELNADRSNHPYGIAHNKRSVYGACEFYVDEVNNIAEPKDSRKGDVARIWLHMSDKYDMVLPGHMRELFDAWNKADPVDLEELQRNHKIYAVQGDDNKYIIQSWENQKNDKDNGLPKRLPAKR